MPRLKVLFLIKSFCAPGGAEHVLAHVAGGLAERGHGIAIASFDPPGAAPFYPTSPDVRLIQRTVGDPGKETRLVEMVGRMFAIRRLLAEVKPDVAVGFMNSSYVPLAPAALGTGIPTVGSEHIVYSHYADRLIERTLIRLSVPLLSAVAAISEPMRCSFPPDVRRKMVVIPNPVSPALVSSDVAGGSSKTLLTVGRMQPQKDHAVLIAAFAQIANRHPDWQLRIVGQGELRGALEEQAARLGIAKRVEFPGVVANIGSELARAQLFAMPSRYESFGLATAEALAHGLPVVGFADCPGTNEIIVDGVNGLLTRPGEASFAEGLERLMASPDFRRRLGEAGPASMQRFSLADVVLQWEGLCLSLSHRPVEWRAR